MKSQHTPGPWQVWGHDIIVKDTDGDDIVICGIGKPANLRSHSYSVPCSHRTKANARLIADAPAMLEALEFAFIALRSSAEPEERSSVADMLWTLIAKHTEPNK